MAFERFSNSNEYDEDLEALSAVSETLAKSFGTTLSVTQKKSLVLLMQEATPFALGLGDRGFIFLKECLMPFTSRMPEPHVILEFFEKQQLPENAEDSPYYASLEEFHGHLKKLADPTSFKTPLKKMTPRKKVVNPKMQLQMEGDDDESAQKKRKEESSEQIKGSAKKKANDEKEVAVSSAAKKGRKASAKEDEEVEASAPEQVSPRKAPAAKKGKMQTKASPKKRKEDEEEAQASIPDEEVAAVPPPAKKGKSRKGRKEEEEEVSAPSPAKKKGSTKSKTSRGASRSPVAQSSSSKSTLAEKVRVLFCVSFCLATDGLKNARGASKKRGKQEEEEKVDDEEEKVEEEIVEASPVKRGRAKKASVSPRTRSRSKK